MKKLSKLLIVVLLVVSGCTSATKQDNYITVVDQIGREVKITKDVKRIVSSYYISTAITILLDKEDELVGIEALADTRGLYKKAAPEIIQLPAVGSGKGIQVEAIAELKPDVVILPKKLKDSVESLEKLNIAVIVVDPETQEDFFNTVKLLGEVYDEKEEADEFLDYYKEKLDFVKTKTESIKDKEKVFLAGGSTYWNTVTSKMYQNDLITWAGGINVSVALQDAYWMNVSPEQVMEWNPAYFLYVQYAQYTADDIKKDEKLALVDALKNDKVYQFPSVIEPFDFPTPSSILGVYWLTQLLHPDVITKDEYIKEAKYFYDEFFDIDVEVSDLGV